MGELIAVYKSDAKRILILTLGLIALICIGCFGLGIAYARSRFITVATTELQQLLLTNFSYTCGYGEDQHYLYNVTMPFS